MMSQSTKYTFLVHALVAAVLGIPLLSIPGRWLPVFGWTADVIDPLVSRVLGAALIAFAWGSYQGWRSVDWEQVAIFVQVEAIFTLLAAVGLLRHLAIASFPVGVWLLFAISLLFAIAWFIALRRK